MNDSIQAAEKKGYAKGYRAGTRRKQKLVKAQSASKAQNAFYNRAFLAALSQTVNTAGWVDGAKKPIVDVQQRVKLADSFAKEALKYWRPA